MYRYTKAIMEEGRHGAEYPGIAFASDWGALFGRRPPRCPDTAACDPSRYPSLKDPFRAVGVGGPFDKQVTGEREFDFDKDDFIKDLTHVGLPPRIVLAF